MSQKRNTLNTRQSHLSILLSYVSPGMLHICSACYCETVFPQFPMSRVEYRTTLHSTQQWNCGIFLVLHIKTFSVDKAVILSKGQAFVLETVHFFLPMRNVYQDLLWIMCTVSTGTSWQVSVITSYSVVSFGLPPLCSVLSVVTSWIFSVLSVVTS